MLKQWPRLAVYHSHRLMRKYVWGAVLAAVCTHKGHATVDNYVAYLLALFIALISLPIEWAVDRRSPELTKDLRFDLAGAMVALAIIRLEATRTIDNIYFTSGVGLQIAIDMYFFVIFLGAKLVGRNGSREVALLVMADIVDFIELTYSMQGCGNTEPCVWKSPAKSTKNAIVAFSFIFALVTLLLQRAEGPGQKALNALVQAIFVNFPIICIRLAIPLNEAGAIKFFGTKCWAGFQSSSHPS